MINLHRPLRITLIFAMLNCLALLSACSSSDSDGVTPPPKDSDVVRPIGDNNLNAALFDTHGDRLTIGGTISINPPENTDNINSYELFWADGNSEEVQGEVLKSLSLESPADQVLSISLDDGLTMPDASVQLKLIAKNAQGDELHSNMIRFLDFTGNAQVSGKGGTLPASWNYGVDRDYLMAHKESTGDTDFCYFDNGLVSVIDMENELDSRQQQTADDQLYPAYSFDCTDSQIHNQKTVTIYNSETDTDEVVTYSALNDAFFYGNIVYSMYFKYLGRPPFEDKFRLRVHYGDEFNSPIYWAGDYANFGDQNYISNGSTSLDIVAHELSHGFLDKNSQLKSTEIASSENSQDARTMHEAFSDISGAAAKYFYTGQYHWLHGDEIKTPLVRDGSKIITQDGAIPSYLDYDEAGNNSYLRIGMMSYPFYLLTQQWGMERSYSLFLHAAQSCWAPDKNLQQGAECLLQAAIDRGESQADVIDAFKAVKIKLFDEGSLAHYEFTPKKQILSFSDTSVSTSNVSQWHWDFGDGTSSTEQHPTHQYSQGGLYHPVLSITDSQGHTDSYTRPVDVFTDYCAPGPGFFVAEMNKLSINGVSIDTSAEDNQYDYTQSIIAISDANHIQIKAEGEGGDNHSFNWKIWLDANDDGIFDNNPLSTEIVHNSSSETGSGYNLETDIQIPQGSEVGPLRLRITGQFGIPSPCALKADNTVDLLLQVQ